DLAGANTFFSLVNGVHELASRDVVERLLNALSRLSTEQFVDADEARKALGTDADVIGIELVDKSIPAGTLSVGRTCPKAPEQALLLREQDGRSARSGCIPKDVAEALHVGVDETRWQTPFAARPDEVEELVVTDGAQKLDLARKDSAFVLRAP